VRPRPGAVVDFVSVSTGAVSSHVESRVGSNASRLLIYLSADRQFRSSERPASSARITTPAAADRNEISPFRRRGGKAAGPRANCCRDAKGLWRRAGRRRTEDRPWPLPSDSSSDGSLCVCVCVCVAFDCRG
jgi:hypothetical protein